MVHSLYISAKGADALKLCICSGLGGQNVDVSVIKSGKSVPDKLPVPLPYLGSPVLVTDSGVVIQDVSTAAVFLGEHLSSNCSYRQILACRLLSCRSAPVIALVYSERDTAYELGFSVMIHDMIASR
jgi:hypothetical protein